MDNILMTSIPREQLEGIFRTIVKEEITESKKQELLDKFISPSEACNLFQPKISRVTLYNWANQGLIPEHRIGGKVYYKYSELMASAKTLKKYKRTNQAA